MKYAVMICMLCALASGCTKSNGCVQCARQVLSATQPSTTVTAYDIEYQTFCGRQGDTAISGDPNVAAAFAAEWKLEPFTCFRKD